jgi:hypothetical protein
MYPVVLIGAGDAGKRCELSMFVAFAILFHSDCRLRLVARSAIVPRSLASPQYGAVEIARLHECNASSGNSPAPPATREASHGFPRVFASRPLLGSSRNTSGGSLIMANQRELLLLAA